MSENNNPLYDALVDLEIDVEDRLRAGFRESLGEHLASLDPNWVSARIRFPYPAGGMYNTHQFPATSIMPVVARMNGPLQGDVDFLGDLPLFVPERIFALLRVLSLFNANSRYIGLYNPRHQIRLIPNKTELGFENGDIGVVTEVSDGGDQFLVARKDNRANPVRRVEEYTMDQLLEELRMEPEESMIHSSAVDVMYAPFLPHPPPDL